MHASADVLVRDSATAIGTSTKPMLSADHPSSPSPAPPARPAPMRRPKQASSPPMTITAAPSHPATPRFDATSSSVNTPVSIPSTGRVVRMSLTSATAAISVAMAPNTSPMCFAA